jgi:beta-glucuronidase
MRSRRGIALAAAGLSIALVCVALAAWLRGPDFEAPSIRCGMTGASFEVPCVDRAPYLLVNDLPYPSHFDAADHAVQSLDGAWMMRPDPDEIGVESGWPDDAGVGPGWREVEVPSTWNAPGSELADYRGVVWYARRFTAEPPTPQAAGRFPRLGFQAVSLRSEVWLNGQRLGSREGGYTPFYFDAGRAIRRAGENLLVVRVDNRLSDASLPPRLSDDYRPSWGEYGGIHRGVRLEWLPLQYIFKVRVRTSRSGEDDATLRVEVFSHHRGGAPPFVLDLVVLDPEGRSVASVSASDPGSTGNEEVERHVFTVELPEARFYGPEDPALYLVGLTLTQGDLRHRVALKTGLREVGVAGGALTLNGERILLRGVGLVEDDPLLGATRSETRMRRDLRLVRDLHANFVRLAHHPHSVRTLRRARNLGILFSEEIPFYRVGNGMFSQPGIRALSRFGLRQLADPMLLDHAQQQIFEMVERDANNPALILWSVGSESFDFGESAGRVHAWLADSVRFLDDTRPVTMSGLTTSLERLDALATAPSAMDVVSVNLSNGAEPGDLDQLGARLDALHARFPDKPILVSQLDTGRPPASGMEQADRLRAAIDRVRSRPYVAGFVIRTLADFLCPGCAGDPWDVGGIVSRDRTPKPAYLELRREWSASEQAVRTGSGAGG